MTDLLTWTRVFHFGSGMILVGVWAFRWLVILPACAGATDAAWGGWEPLWRRLEAVLVGAAAILVASGAAMFWAVAAEMSGASLSESLNGETWRTVWLETQFGVISQWRVGFAVVLAAALARLVYCGWMARRRISMVETVGGVAAVALVVSESGMGHAAAAGGALFWVRVLGDGTHLLAAAIWPGGLLPFALFLSDVRQRSEKFQPRFVMMVVRRFSALSFCTVGVLVASGMVNACFILGSLTALIDTDYGRLLGLKLFLFLIILGFAAWNRWRLVPRFSSEADLAGEGTIHSVLGRLRSFVTVELSLAGAIVVVVSILGTTPPPG